MAKHHTPRERLQLFMMGFRRGASTKCKPEHIKGDSDFEKGYSLGRSVHAKAMDKARKVYGVPSESILRSNEEE